MSNMKVRSPRGGDLFGFLLDGCKRYEAKPPHPVLLAKLLAPLAVGADFVFFESTAESYFKYFGRYLRVNGWPVKTGQLLVLPVVRDDDETDVIALQIYTDFGEGVCVGQSVDGCCLRFNGGEWADFVVAIGVDPIDVMAYIKNNQNRAKAGLATLTENNFRMKVLQLQYSCTPFDRIILLNNRCGAPSGITEKKISRLIPRFANFGNEVEIATPRFSPEEISLFRCIAGRVPFGWADFYRLKAYMDIPAGGDK